MQMSIVQEFKMIMQARLMPALAARIRMFAPVAKLEKRIQVSQSKH